MSTTVQYAWTKCHKSKQLQLTSVSCFFSPKRARDTRHQDKQILPAPAVTAREGPCENKTKMYCSPNTERCQVKIATREKRGGAHSAASMTKNCMRLSSQTLHRQDSTVAFRVFRNDYGFDYSFASACSQNPCPLAPPSKETQVAYYSYVHLGQTQPHKLPSSLRALEVAGHALCRLRSAAETARQVARAEWRVFHILNKPDVQSCLSD